MPCGQAWQRHPTWTCQARPVPAAAPNAARTHLGPHHPHLLSALPWAPRRALCGPLQAAYHSRGDQGNRFGAEHPYIGSLTINQACTDNGVDGP